MIHHGGKLLAVAEQYGVPAEQWIDLSTGISPFTYSHRDIPESAWNELPQDNDGLEEAAANYYGSSILPLPVAGSQAAIRALPAVIFALRNKGGTVAIPQVGYKEHHFAWSKVMKWDVSLYQDAPSEAQIAQADVVLIINPNNPTGYRIAPEKIAQWLKVLSDKGGYLIIDEAFIDCTAEESVIPLLDKFDNLVVLRSVGKFFGLAGARTGFVFAARPLLEATRHLLGPWTVSGPSRAVVKQALLDTQWQLAAREQLHENGQRLHQLLTRYFGETITGTTMFKTVKFEQAPELHHLLCQHQVLTRLCDEKDAIRFGLPKDEQAWLKLENALRDCVPQLDKA